MGIPATVSSPCGSISHICWSERRASKSLASGPGRKFLNVGWHLKCCWSMKWEERRKKGLMFFSACYFFENTSPACTYSYCGLDLFFFALLSVISKTRRLPKDQVKVYFEQERIPDTQTEGHNETESYESWDICNRCSPKWTYTLHFTIPVNA